MSSALKPAGRQQLVQLRLKHTCNWCLPLHQIQDLSCIQESWQSEIVCQDEQSPSDQRVEGGDQGGEIILETGKLYALVYPAECLLLETIESSKPTQHTS